MCAVRVTGREGVEKDRERNHVCVRVSGGWEVGGGGNVRAHACMFVYVCVCARERARAFVCDMRVRQTYRH